jgi:DNA-binding beta-propeller fold protein YncE
MTSKHRLTNRKAGFTLIAVVIFLTVAMIIMVSILPGKQSGSKTLRGGATVSKLEKVEQAMTGFMALNGRLPCPADGQYGVSTGNFGIEAATQGTCTGGTPSAPLGPDAGTGYVVGGVIPTKSLGLEDSLAFDEWGRFITYVVDTRATLKSSCFTLQNFPTNTGTGGIAIESSTGGTVLNNVMHAFISHGPDGHGAFPEQGSTVANRINAGSIDTDEMTNAGVNSSFAYSTANFTNVKVQKPPTATFGDVVYYANYQKNLCCVGGVTNCTASNGPYWYVTDGTNNKVQKFSSTGTYISQFGSSGSGNGQFGIADYIAIDSSGNVWVTDDGNDKVEEFNSSGAYVSQFGSEGSGNGQFLSPTGIAIDSSNNIWVADFSNHRVEEFNSSGTYVSQFGTSGSGNGQLSNPQGLAIDPAGNIWVVDEGNNRVEKFSNTGLYISQFGTSGSGNGQFDHAIAIAIDCNSNIWVTDTLNDRVQEFNTSGAYVSQFAGSYDWFGIATDPSGNIWMADTSAYRVEEYSSSGVAGTTFGSNGTGNGQFKYPVGIAYSPRIPCTSPGFRINGSTASGQLGYGVYAGDVNGDGIQDLVIYESINNIVYVVFGTTTGITNPLPIGVGGANLNGSNGFTILNSDSVNGVGFAVGDIDGDGAADIAITGNDGNLRVLYGPKCGGTWATPCSASYDFNSITACQGFKLQTTQATDGIQAAVIGDVNGDSVGDLIFGNPYDGPGATGTVTFTTNPANNATVSLDGVSWKFTTGSAGSGKTVVQGTLAATLTQLASDLNASTNTSIKPASYSASATVLTVTYKGGGTAGNNYALAVGTAASAVSGSKLTGGTALGWVFVLFGQNNAKTCPGTGSVNGTATTIIPEGLNMTTSPKASIITSPTNTGDFGQMLAVGDVDNSGIKDVIIGDPGYTAGGVHGRLYVVFGQSTWPSTIAAGSLTTNASPYGIIINDSTSEGFIGGNYSGAIAAGDVTGDGIADILVGSSDGTPRGNGKAWVIKGMSNAAWQAYGTGPFTLSTMITGGKALKFTNDCQLGSGVAIADINHDGVGDLIMGDVAWTGTCSQTGTNGSVFVVFGGASLATRNLSSSPLTGTDGFRIDCSYVNNLGGSVNSCGQYNAAGDINGDGTQDVIVGVGDGSVTGSNQEGYVYTLFGKSSGWPAKYPLSTIY